MKNNKILFLTELWCDNNPNLGLTNNFHNLIATFIKAKPEYDFHLLHFDEAKLIYGRHIDEVLVPYCKHFDISAVVFSLQGGNSTNPNFPIYGSELNPSINCLSKLKELGISIIIMWPDTGPTWGTATIQQLGDIPDLNVSWDNPISDYHNSIPKRDNHLHLWCPQDSNIYFKIPDEQKDIELSFLGSDRYQDRKFFLHHLLQNFPTMVFRGGQREEKLTHEQYAELMRRSKISINFSLSPAGFYQTKGRVFEILACGNLLFEFKNPSTQKLLTPNEDYVEFESVEDLITKIKFYISNTDEYNRISRNGYKKYIENFHPNIFWNRVFDKLNELKK